MSGVGKPLPVGTEPPRMRLRDHIEELEPSVLVLVGFALFIFPEPATSALGIGLMLLGAVWWVREWR